MRSRSRARKTLLRSCCYTIQIFQSEKYDDLKHTFLPTYTWLKETLKLCSNISITLWPPNVNIFLVPNFIRLHSIKPPSWQLYSPSPWGEGDFLLSAMCFKRANTVCPCRDNSIMQLFYGTSRTPSPTICAEKLQLVTPPSDEGGGAALAVTEGEKREANKSCRKFGVASACIV